MKAVTLNYFNYLMFLLSLNGYATVNLEQETNGFHQYCIIGAGPGGLQIAYFLQQAGREYVVYEKGYQAGSFFQKYPIRRRMKTMTKRHTGTNNKDIKLRYDLNSLISHDESLQMSTGRYSKDLYPNADEYVRYLNDYANKLKLNIQYHTVIGNIEKHVIENGHLFRMNDQHNNSYICEYVILATGTGKPIKHTHEGSEFVEYYSDVSLDLKEYAGKSVLVIGSEDQAFEIGNYILSSTSSVHIASSKYEFSWSSHYPGHLDATAVGIFDTYLLKSLDGILFVHADPKKWNITKREVDDKLVVSFNRAGYSRMDGNEKARFEADNFEMREGYNKIIRCDGFQWDSSVFADNITIRLARREMKENLPKMNLAYESSDVRKLYFAGSLMHALDFKKSSGGYINGFRYTTKSLHNMLEWKNHGRKWPYIQVKLVDDLMAHIAKRVVEASDLFHMYGMLCDVAIYNKLKTEATYIQGYPCLAASKVHSLTGHEMHGAFLLLLMKYGKSNFEKDPAGKKETENSQSHLRTVLYSYVKKLSDDDIKSSLKTWTLPKPYEMYIFTDNILEDCKNSTAYLLSLKQFITKTT